MDTSQNWGSVWGLDDKPQPDEKNSIPAFFNLEGLMDMIESDKEPSEEDKDELKKWLDTAIPTLQEQNTEFSRKAVENLMFYKGVQTEQHRHYYNFEDAHRFVKNNKVSLNIIYEFVELWVNKTAEYKADISSIPKTNDQKARDNAKAKELAVKDFIEKNKINELINKFQRQTFIFGEGYIHLRWDQDKGPLHPAFEEIKDQYKKLKRITTPSGDEVSVMREPRIGDVAASVVAPIYVLKEDRNWEELDYLILNIRENIDKLRTDYPDIELKGSGDVDSFWMYHLPTKYLPTGAFVRYACGEVLEVTEFPYDKPVFPVIHMTDIDIEGSGRGKSFVENIKPHQVLINETISEVWNNLRRTGKGKWVLPAKTANPKHLAPSSPAIEYYGNIQPTFVSYPSMKAEAIRFIELLREYAEKQARVHGIAQGTPPPNVRSGLQFAQLEEMEKKAVSLIIEKRYNAIEQLGEVASLIMGKFYEPEDGRTVTIFGKDKEYLNKALNVDAIREDHAIKIKADNSLPTGTASQFSFFADLREKFGNTVVPDELMIDMLDSGRFNQYTEFAGATVETTNEQMSAMLEGKEPSSPEPYEDLILKWKIVVGTMRKRSFLSYDDTVKSLFEDFVYAIEDLIINKPNQTPAMAERIQMLQSFPVFYSPPVAQFAEGQPSQGPAQPISPEEVAAAEALAGAELPEAGMEEIPQEVLNGAGGGPV